MTYLQKLKRSQDHYKGVFKAILAKLEPERAFYACKECSSKGELFAPVAYCPVCGSRYVQVASSEYKIDSI